MMYAVDELAPSLNGPKGLKRMHWASYKKVRDRWTLLLREQRPARAKPAGRCTVRIVRRYCPHPLRDWDNLYASAKVPLDAMRQAGIIADDTTDCVVHLTMQQERVARKSQQQTTIHVVELLMEEDDDNAS